MMQGGDNVPNAGPNPENDGHGLSVLTLSAVSLLQRLGFENEES